MEGYHMNGTNENTTQTSNDFERYLGILREHLAYVEDDSFRWDDVTAFLIIKLTNTDSWNKESTDSHATQIQITDRSDPLPGMSPTEDFFPTLTLNTTFKYWRLSVPARIHNGNIVQLKGDDPTGIKSWINDTIQIRRRILNRRILNVTADNPGNPTLHICYGDDLRPLRELLLVDDYLVIVKRRLQPMYDVFGLRSDIDLGSGKNLYKSPRSDRDSTVFSISQLIGDTDDKETEYISIPMKPKQIIVYGAPGTGKSYNIDRKISEFYADPVQKAEHTIRVTFHPDYEYSDFVGAIRPVRDSKAGLNYVFVPGPMTQVLAKCFKHPSEVFFLVIEEINRGNASAIFGDLFQLLDRGPSGRSVYEVNNEEIADFLTKETGYTNTFKHKKIWFPPNLSILCSMNTADQNVFVLDTAFSRRFEREYVKIDFNQLEEIADEERKKLYTSEIPIFGGVKPLVELLKDSELNERGVIAELDANGKLKRNWPTFALLVNQLIDIVNDREGIDQISEDKKLGPFFVSETDLSSREAFLNKVIYYLKHDVFRYTDSYFNEPFQNIYNKYLINGDFFDLLRMGD